MARTRLRAARVRPTPTAMGSRTLRRVGYRYQRTSADQPSGAYEVAATSFWRVEWAGGGMTGVIEFDLSATADIRVGEAQVLTQ